MDDPKKQEKREIPRGDAGTGRDDGIPSFSKNIEEQNQSIEYEQPRQENDDRVSQVSKKTIFERALHLGILNQDNEGFYPYRLNKVEDRIYFMAGQGQEWVKEYTSRLEIIEELESGGCAVRLIQFSDKKDAIYDDVLKLFKAIEVLGGDAFTKKFEIFRAKYIKGEELSKPEKDTLMWVVECEDREIKEIAEIKGYALSTIKGHLSGIYKKTTLEDGEEVGLKITRRRWRELKLF